MARIRKNMFHWSLGMISNLWVMFCFLTRRWEILTIEWPSQSSQLPGGDQEAGDLASAWGEKWKVPIARAALFNFQERLYSTEMSIMGIRWENLEDFDEPKEWGNSK